MQSKSRDYQCSKDVQAINLLIDVWTTFIVIKWHTLLPPISITIQEPLFQENGYFTVICTNKSLWSVYFILLWLYQKFLQPLFRFMKLHDYAVYSEYYWRCFSYEIFVLSCLQLTKKHKPMMHRTLSSLGFGIATCAFTWSIVMGAIPVYCHCGE